MMLGTWPKEVSTDSSMSELERLHPAAIEPLAKLVEAILQLEGLTDQLGPFSLMRSTCRSDALPVVEAICEELRIPLSFDRVADKGSEDFAVEALGAEIKLAQAAPELAGLSEDQVRDVRAAAREISQKVNGQYQVHTVRRPDGTLVKVLESGSVDAPTVLISPACAMSYRLSLPWMVALAQEFRCLVVQTRGTTERIVEPAQFDERGYDVHDQAEDLLAVVGAMTSEPVHLMGLCGGAVPGMLMAAQQPTYVSSMSFWHADLDFGSEAAKTDHQTNLRELLDAAGASRASAAMIRDMLASSELTGVPAVSICATYWRDDALGLWRDSGVSPSPNLDRDERGRSHCASRRFNSAGRNAP